MTTVSSVWVLEKRKADGWEFCNVFATPDSAQKAAPEYHPAPAPIRWDNAAFSSVGYFGTATVSAFRLRLLVVQR